MNNNDVSKKLEELLSGMNPSVLKNGRQNIEQILQSQQGRTLANQLSGADKQKLLSAFMSLDNDEIRKKLKNVKMSDLSGLSAEDILKKLR
jgi:hypothetical protein